MAKRASTLARPLAPRASQSRCACARRCAMRGTSAGSVQCTSPATSPVAGLRTLPVVAGVMSDVAVIASCYSAQIGGLSEVLRAVVDDADQPGAGGDRRIPASVDDALQVGI